MANGEAEAKPVAPAAPDEPMDVNTAVQNVLKKALAYDGLARGLQETARALDRGEANINPLSCHMAASVLQACYRHLTAIMQVAMCTHYCAGKHSKAMKGADLLWASVCAGPALRACRGL